METISSKRAHRSGRWKKIIIVVGLIILVAAVFWAKNQRQTADPRQGGRHINSAESTLLRKRSSEKADAAEQGRTEPLPRLIDLGADKCIPCKMMAPILEELKEEYKGVFEVMFIDVWKDPQPARQYKIRVIPTQIFLDGSGKELFRHEGFFSKEDILNKWAELGIEVQEQ
jgi:thiol-disulfide isomerase/thioredoxin